MYERVRCSMNIIDWQSDIEQMRIELPRLHNDFFQAKNEAEFYRKIDELQKHSRDMDTYRIVMALARIVATAKDAHTAVMLPQNYRLPFDCYPFAEGLYVIATNHEHKDLLHTKILKIGPCEAATIYRKLTEIIPHENMQFVLSSLPSFIRCVDILYGIGIITDPEEIIVTVEDDKGHILKKAIGPLKYDDYQVIKTISQDLPLYRQNREKFYWSRFDDGVFYISYSKCRDMESLSVRDFSESLKSEIAASKAVGKVVLDFRNNSGGNSELFKPFLVWLSHNININQKGKLFVIVGRDTFSSASLNVYYLKFNTNAIFIGEPTGAKPNHFGEVKYLELKSSGLMIRYSTKYYELIEDDAELCFMPDVECKVSFEDYVRGIDKCMAAVVAL